MDCLQKIPFLYQDLHFHFFTQCEEGTSEVDGSWRTGCGTGGALWPVHRARTPCRCVYVHSLDRGPRLACVPAGHGHESEHVTRWQPGRRGKESKVRAADEGPVDTDTKQETALWSQLPLMTTRFHSLFEEFLKDYWSEPCSHTAVRIILTGLVWVSDSRNWRD